MVDETAYDFVLHMPFVTNNQAVLGNHTVVDVDQAPFKHQEIGELNYRGAIISSIKHLQQSSRW